MKQWAVLIVTLLFSIGYAAQSNILLKEDFNSIESWKPLKFPKIKQYTIYSILTENGNSYLKAEANRSASGIIFKRIFNVFEYPLIKWRWKISNIYKKGNAKKKSGDDYPIRIYVIFKYDPPKASFIEKAIYNGAKLIYGEYPPHSSLNYIWANRVHEERIITSPYTNKSRMITIEAGPSKSGQWIDEKTNILEDYKRAFGEDPPAMASLAIMSDADNTKEHAVAYIDHITIYRKDH